MALYFYFLGLHPTVGFHAQQSIHDHALYIPEVVGYVARMTELACHVANRPQASALIATLNDVREAAQQKSGYSLVT